MMGCLSKKVIEARGLMSGIISRCYSLWTPDYLETMKPKIPQYPVVNIRMRGYDFPVLESYQKLAHIIAVNMDFEIDNSYAIPAQDLKIQKFKPRSTVAEAEYILHCYERNILISDLPSPKFPVYVRMLEAALPEGVTLNVLEWKPEREELRYVPDKQLLDLKTELESIRKPKK
ncbi:uncharacterized protein LOC107041804 [Diachasma alloeum]|uniref:uncharacterized protein LOC107041804 n=1 Tax=Diachasma alloeum TaxID=454923 RepID=UPI00073833C1|nr:uncharacterized protein LOC107041804 [Diachasma alloeum]